jgi:hypothetical protein
MPTPIRLRLAGLVGTPPPPDAPREVSQPLTAEAQADMIAKARAHQGRLSPAAEATISGVKISELPSPGVASVPAPRRPPIPSPEAAAATQPVVEGSGVSLPPASPSPPPPVEASALSPEVSPAALPALPDLAVSPHALPALPPDATQAERDDPVVNARPTRGQPHPVADPNLRPTGGFGVPGAEEVSGFGVGGGSEYFPLDGGEVREVILSLMDKVVEQVGRDLRLTISTTYPLLAVTVTVKVERDQQDQTFVIEQRLDEARGFPPDLVREQLGIAVPRKQAVNTPTGPVMVDRLS